MEPAAHVVAAAIFIDLGNSISQRRLRSLFRTEEGARAFDALIAHMRARNGACFVSGLPLFSFHPYLVNPMAPRPAVMINTAKNVFDTAFDELTDAACKNVPTDSMEHIRVLCGPNFVIGESDADMEWRMRVMRFRTKYRGLPELLLPNPRFLIPQRLFAVRVMIPWCISALHPTKKTTTAECMIAWLEVIAELVHVAYPGPKVVPPMDYMTALKTVLGELVALSCTPRHRLAWAIASSLETNLPNGKPQTLAMCLGARKRKVDDLAYPRLPTELWSSIWKEFVADS